MKSKSLFTPSMADLPRTYITIVAKLIVHIKVQRPDVYPSQYARISDLLAQLRDELLETAAYIPSVISAMNDIAREILSLIPQTTLRERLSLRQYLEKEYICVQIQHKLFDFPELM